ncbi:transposase [Oceanicoccus sagamiensis]|uniref:Transposase n=1 Tax=Oceanicoccus sagamiensis TaxID=716816 RepID=A0A1X9N360_9GAMM|nr:transposase [Oceanicoccus sagamiensis]ARN72648.1 transposase [Oceanicoccus sagamiensis]
MTQPRKTLVSIADTPYYHIVSRCVRRSYLCGVDHHSGKSYEHRRQWIVDRIRLLSSLFAVDLCSYAVMSNHYHLVVKLNPDQVNRLTDQEVIDRWLSLFKGPLLVQRFNAGIALSKPELDTVSEIITLWRKRLADLSWFMKCLNQPIARKANLEDQCTGHFWEGRFKSQALLTDEALLSCMAYVDLNPVRAAMAQTPEDSDYTAIQERIKPQFDLQQAIHSQTDSEDLLEFNHALKPLLPFEGNITNDNQEGLLFSFTDYLELVDWTGRAIALNKRGAIPSHLPNILKRLSVNHKTWLSSATRFEALHRHRFGRRRPGTKSTTA